MTIKAILLNGRIQPLEPIPPDWADGQQLVIEPPEVSDGEPEVRAWVKDLDTAATRLSADEHDRFQRALSEIERESKEIVRREWGLT